METDNKASDRSWVNVERFGQLLSWFGPVIVKKDPPSFLDGVSFMCSYLLIYRHACHSYAVPVCYVDTQCASKSMVPWVS